MRTLDWRELWYVKECCKLGKLCPRHLDRHQRACGSGDGKKCDICDVNLGVAQREPTGEQP